jgi:methylglyoxal synthase
MNKVPKTLIGILATHDNVQKNEALTTILDSTVSSPEGKEILSEYSFVFTGGTCARLFDGQPCFGQHGNVRHRLKTETQTFLLEECGVVRLPANHEGGVTILSTLISQRMVSIIWTFFSPLTTHLLFPDNLALLRLADQWRVKKLMNSGSVAEWLKAEAKRDARLNPQSIDVELVLPGSGTKVSTTEDGRGFRCLQWEHRTFPDFIQAKADGHLDETLQDSVLALISHDEMKSRMLDFAIDHEQELRKFGRILATGTTGTLVGEAAPSLSPSICKYHSGPKGGDVEIATEILFDGCHVVIFFVDPLHPHPHTEDIRVVFGACMIHDRVRMLSNEIQARHWMDRMIRC